ncbi:AlpA family transcriptional regulator [Caballeronia mineralivorans]|jgi:prophage regulatory protein|uniref:helix-turn-helix transcriptional regulator n=1 Tax=Caballeronia mineralivorans TaxID=2010198 RepID=UPI002AFE3473|nr:AlpA family transcriptional regulator [Caballeronia mineralivorans]
MLLLHSSSLNLMRLPEHVAMPRRSVGNDVAATSAGLVGKAAFRRHPLKPAGMFFHENPATKHRLIRLRGVRMRVGLGTSTVCRYLAKGEFPRPVQIGGGRVAWVERDIDAWIADRIEADPSRT